MALACAGIVPYTPTMSLDTKLFETIMAVNLLGSVYVAKHAAIAMVDKNKKASGEGKGVILFTSSVAAWEGLRGSSAYSASKGAINGLVLPMARDLGKYGIRVAAIAPGIFNTQMFSSLPKHQQAMASIHTPMRRPGLTHEFAHMVQFCIENGYINGVSLRIDGATVM